MTEQFASFASSTLDGDITSGATSLDVIDASSFPTTGQFRLLIDSEIILVTGVASNTFTVLRGREGTTPAAHLDTVVVDHVLTAGAIQQHRLDNCGSDVIGSRPAAGVPGRLYIPTDGMTIQRDNGTDWDIYGPIHKFVPPPSVSGFTWVNQGGATAADQGGIIRMVAPQIGSENARILKMAAPGTPYTITACIKFVSTISTSTMRWGLCWRESGSGKLVTVNYAAFDFFGECTHYMVITKWDNETTTNSDYYAKLQWTNTDCQWLRITDNGTNRICSLSSDGVNFFQIHSVGRTDFITADEIGFFIDPIRSSDIFYNPEMHVLSWEQT